MKKKYLLYFCSYLCICNFSNAAPLSQTINMDASAIVNSGFYAQKISDMDFGDVFANTVDDLDGIKMDSDGSLSPINSRNVIPLRSNGTVGQIAIYAPAGVSVTANYDTVVDLSGNTSNSIQLNPVCYIEGTQQNSWTFTNSGTVNLNCFGNLTKFVDTSGSYTGSFTVTISN